MAPHLSKKENEKFRSIVRDLKKKFPPPFPIRIRTVKTLKGYLGKTQFIEGGKNPYFLITLMQDKYQNFLDVLIHEWGHVLSWKVGFNNEDRQKIFHDEGWAVEYSKLYRYVFEPEELEPIAGKCESFAH